MCPCLVNGSYPVLLLAAFDEILRSVVTQKLKGTIYYQLCMTIALGFTFTSLKEYSTTHYETIRQSLYLGVYL